MRYRVLLRAGGCSALLWRPGAASYVGEEILESTRPDGGLELPWFLACDEGVSDSSSSAASGVNIFAAARELISLVAPTDEQQASSRRHEDGWCPLGDLARVAAEGGRDADLLALAASPGLLAADLARAGPRRRWLADLALDPWLRAHCRELEDTGMSDAAACRGIRFDDVVTLQHPAWFGLGKALYERLQPVESIDEVGMECLGAASKERALSVSVIGSHSGLSIAVSAAFLAAMQEVGQRLELAYLGHWAWCQNVDNCDEPLAQMFRKYQQDWAETDDDTNTQNFAQLTDELSQLLRGGEPKRLFAAELLLCTRPFLFCWLVRELWPEGLAHIPMMHYYSGPLLFDTPARAQQQVLQAFRQTVLSSAKDLVLSSSVLQSAWMLGMAGVAVPHVRPHAAALRGLYAPPEGPVAELRALVLRSTWIGTLMGEAFRFALASFLSANELEGRLHVEWLMGDKFLQYEDMAQFHAAVFFPEQPDKLTFWEQYEMAQPLWLPSVDFWVRIHALGEFRYSVFAKRWAAALPEGENASRACGLPAPLFFEAGRIEELPLDSPATAAFWFHLTDYSIFPNLQLFESAAELLEQLLAADLRAISGRMAEFNLQTWRRSVAFYQRACCALLASAGGSPDAPLTPRFLPQPNGPSGWAAACGGA